MNIDYLFQNSEEKSTFITIQDVIDQNILLNPKLLAGKNALDNKSNLMVILETPDGLNYLQGTEIILTAGFAISHSDELKNNLITNAKKAGASALCIKDQRYFGDISENLIRQADECNLPLILLPKESNYTFMMMRFYKYLFYIENKTLLEQNQAYFDILSIQHELTTLDDILQRISSIIGCEIVYSNHYQKSNLLLDPTTLDTKPRKLFKGNKSYTRFVIRTAEVLSYIDVYSQEELSMFHIQAIEYAMAIIKMRLVNRQESLWNESELHHTLGLILHNNLENSDPIFLRQLMEIMHWKDEHYYVIYIIRNSVQSNEHDMKELKLAKVINKNIRKFLEESSLGQFLYVEGPSNMILYVNSDRQTIEHTLDTLFHNTTDLSSYISVGISSEAKDLSNLSKQHQEAYTASLGKQIYTFFDDLGIGKYLNCLAHDTSSSSLCKTTIVALKNYDQQNDGNLLNTIEAYFAHDMSRTATAEALFIHPETLRYRLKQVEEITGVSPYTSDGIFKLMLAISVSKLKSRD